MEPLTDEQKQHLGSAIDQYNRNNGVQVAAVCLTLLAVLLPAPETSGKKKSKP